MILDAQGLIRSIHAAWCLDFLSRIVRFNSVGGAPGETELARFLVGQMKGLGLEAGLQHVEGERYNAIGTWRGGGRGGRLILNGHIDTNPVGEGWTVDPWAGLVDEKFIYGIGVSNMKAGDAAYLCAVKALRDLGVRLRGDVVLMYVVGELQGGIGTAKALEEGLWGDCFLVAEPTDLAALTMHAGAFNFIVELTGSTRHVSKREEATDAIAAACALVPRINAAVFSGAAGAEQRSLNRANVGVLRGSLTSEFNDTRPPQVADFARMVGTARYAAGQSEESVLADLRRMVGELEREFPGLKGRVFPAQREAGRPATLPFEAPRGSRIVQAVHRAYEAVRGGPQPTGAIPPPCFFWTDAAHLQHIGKMEGVVCGPGGRYNTMPDERVDIVDYLDMVRICMMTILDICGVE